MINENLKNKRLKERFTMRNGMSGQIIEYRKATDCDFRFDDGTVIKHLTYYQIANKSVKNPNIQNVKITKKQNEIVGNENMMKCGLNCRVICYRNSLDIDVRFDDGVIVEHVALCAFERKQIKHPTLKSLRDKKTLCNSEAKKKRIGKHKISNSGMKMEIIDYISFKEVLVRFSNGVEKWTSWDKFQSGSVSPYNLAFERIGMEKYMHCGLRAKIIEYYDASNITILFENGFKKETSYQAFSKGAVAPR